MIPALYCMTKDDSKRNSHGAFRSVCFRKFSTKDIFKKNIYIFTDIQINMTSIVCQVTGCRTTQAELDSELQVFSCKVLNS